MKAIFFVLSLMAIHPLLSAQKSLDFEQTIPAEEEAPYAEQISNDTLPTDTLTSLYGFNEKKDPRIDLLIEDYSKNKKINGFRIQIFSSSNNRWEAVKARSEFLKTYPDEESTLVYQAPNYKVRIGNFTSRLEAHKALELIKIDFPSAFIVKDEVQPKLKNSK